MPQWVDAGFADYAKRMPRECALRLLEVPARKRGKNSDARRIVTAESRDLLAAVPRDARIVALDRSGEQWSSERLALLLGQWLQDGRDIALLVGGPDGLADCCTGIAERRWSLSPLTFAHALVRVVAAEQIYRAWTILRNLPYHR